jgi:hypothetical protein
MMKYRIFEHRSTVAKFLICPTCNSNKGMTVKVLPQTVLIQCPVFCRCCKMQYMIDYKDGIETVTATLTQTGMPA